MTDTQKFDLKICARVVFAEKRQETIKNWKLAHELKLDTVNYYAEQIMRINDSELLYVGECY